MSDHTPEAIAAYRDSSAYSMVPPSPADAWMDGFDTGRASMQAENARLQGVIEAALVVWDRANTRAESHTAPTANGNSHDLPLVKAADKMESILRTTSPQPTTETESEERGCLECGGIYGHYERCTITTETTGASAEYQCRHHPACAWPGCHSVACADWNRKHLPTETGEQIGESK